MRYIYYSYLYVDITETHVDLFKETYFSVLSVFIYDNKFVPLVTVLTL